MGSGTIHILITDIKPEIIPDPERLVKITGSYPLLNKTNISEHIHRMAGFPLNRDIDFSL